MSGAIAARPRSFCLVTRVQPKNASASLSARWCSCGTRGTLTRRGSKNGLHLFESLRCCHCMSFAKAVGPGSAHGCTGKIADDGIERVTTQTVFDILEIPQRSRGAGACRRLAAVMAELGWTAVRVRGLTRGGYREQVRGYAATRDTNAINVADRDRANCGKASLSAQPCPISGATPKTFARPSGHSASDQFCSIADRPKRTYMASNSFLPFFHRYLPKALPTPLQPWRDGYNLNSIEVGVGSGGGTVKRATAHDSIQNNSALPQGPSLSLGASRTGGKQLEYGPH